MIGLLALALLSPPQEPSLDLQVEGAISRGIRWVKAQQARDGSWPGHEDRHPGGMTALACFTLVKSDVAADDPALFGGLKSVAGVHFASTYSAAVDLLLFAALRDVRAQKGPGEAIETALGGATARASFDFLVASSQEGLWSYPGEALDASNTQFALLGLRAGAQLGYDTPERLLEHCASALVRQQEESGGFAYHRGDAERGGMTAATLAGIAVITELARGNATVLSPFAKKKDRLKAAEAWMESRWDAARQAFGPNGWTPTFQYEYLWAVERWCGLSGRKKLGAHDWYREGAEFLLEKQGTKGDWEGSLEDTCFALLFLRRATMTGWEDRSALYKRLDEESRRAKEKPEIAPSEKVPRITDWLLAGPYRDDPQSRTFVALDLSKLRPRERQKFQDKTFGRVELKADGWTDLEVATGIGGDHIDWIVATTLAWSPPAGEKAPADGILWFAFEDAWKIWLDGKLVSSEMRMAAPITESVQVPVALEPGEHELVVLVADHTGASAFSCRITDRSGKAMPAGFSAGTRKK